MYLLIRKYTADGKWIYKHICLCMCLTISYTQQLHRPVTYIQADRSLYNPYTVFNLPGSDQAT